MGLGGAEGIFPLRPGGSHGPGGLGTPVPHPQPHQGPIQTTPLLFFPRHSQKQVEVIAWM